MELLAVMASDRSTDPLAPLWERAQQAAEAGDMPGVLFIWKALAEKGAWHICARIGEMYERGADSVRPDIEQALYWYRKAVFEGDDPIAHVGLGRAYYNGSGVQANFEKALEHFQKAGAQGLPEANIYLGLMYYRGVAVTRDSRIAEEYFARAMEAGYPVAYAYLARIAFFRGRIGRAISLMLRGIALGSRIARKDPADPRLPKSAHRGKGAIAADAELEASSFDEGTLTARPGLWQMPLLDDTADTRSPLNPFEASETEGQRANATSSAPL